jgi:hypothetical protein
MDWDDIKYLEQFPPSFWGKALARRYNEKLFQTEKAASEGKKVNDIEDVILGNVMFKNINTGANKLHEKITKDVDDLAFSEMEKSSEHRNSYQGGHYGLDLSGAKKSKEHDLQFGEGYIGLSLKQAKNLLSKWKQGVNEGWLGKTRHLERKRVKKNAKERPVYSYKHLEKHPYRGKRFHVTDDGKGQWYGYRVDKNGVPSEDPSPFTEYLEILKPGTSISRKAVKDHGRLRKLADAAHDQAIKVAEAIEKNPNLHLQDALRKYMGDEWKDYHAIIDPVTRKQLAKEHEDLRFSLDKQGPARQGQNVTIKQQKQMKERMAHIEHIIGLGDSFDQNFGQLDKENLPVVLTWVGDELHKKADDIVDNAEKYDAHDWNLHKFSTLKHDPSDPFSDYLYKKVSHHDAVGFGAFNTNKNQKERLHSGITNLKVDPRKLRDEMMPYLVQAGTQSGSTPDGDHVPYVISPGEDDKIQSPIAIGINRFLRKPSTFGDSPAFIAMKNNWWLLFQNAADDLWGRIGTKDFINFIDARNNKDPQFIDAAFRKLLKYAEKVGEEYARSVYQVTKRQQKQSLDEPVSGGQSLGELLAHEDNKIQDETKKLVYNRKIRSAESEPHTTGHDISELKKFIARETETLSSALETPATGVEDQETANRKNNMMKNIVDAGVAFQAYRNYYIWDMIKAKKDKIAKGEPVSEKDDWTMQGANAYAAKQVKQHQRQKGIPAYGGEINAYNSRSIKSIAEKEREEEKSLRQRIRNAETLGTAKGIESGEDAIVSSAVTFLDNIKNSQSNEEKAKWLNHLFTLANEDPNPNSSVHDIARGVIGELGPDYIKKLGVQMPQGGVPTQDQMSPQVAKTMRLADNPRFVATLDKTSPQYNEKHRYSFEGWVRRKLPGWEKVQGALNRADTMSQRPTG